MNKLLITAVALSAISFSAIAEEFSLGFSIPTGSVIASEGGVKPANETISGQRSIEQDGFVVGGGVIYVGKSGVEVPVNDIRGKSKTQITSIIGSAITDQLSVDQINELASSIDTIADKAGQSVADQVAEQIANSDATADQISAYAQAVANGTVHDAASDQAFRDANGIK